jgi:hypothetical protein
VASQTSEQSPTEASLHKKRHGALRGTWKGGLDNDELRRCLRALTGFFRPYHILCGHGPDPCVMQPSSGLTPTIAFDLADKPSNV